MLFGCATTNEQRFVGICGVTDEQGNTTGLRYVYRTERGEELSYPENPADSRKLLFFSHRFKAHLYEANVRFMRGGYTYHVFFRDNPPSTEPDTVTGPDAGVEVTARSGKRVALIECGERPASYFDEIRRLSACDIRNPLGEKACAQDAPEVP
ncbi:hypothetical protein [Aestuariivirga sp.]|uniref:hypothetical protein n=1 Tax=Aestuariivirga sp. TaxID=2650926 RepID=UPI0039E596A6